jgi:Lipid A 3-O-deacylase (PagL)
VGLHARRMYSAIERIPGRPEWFLEPGVDYWRANDARSGAKALVAVSLIAGLRWRPSPLWFIDGSVGPSALSHTNIDGRELGIALQFASRLAAGMVFGTDRRHELATFVEHTSNGHTAEPNSGVTFLGLQYRYTLP